jgi:hypothetical protein
MRFGTYQIRLKCRQKQISCSAISGVKYNPGRLKGVVGLVNRADCSLPTTNGQQATLNKVTVQHFPPEAPHCFCYSQVMNL